MLIHTHIPRTGGVTLRGILKQVYPSVWGMGEHQYKELSLYSTGEYQCLSGHVPFGIHYELPGSSHRYITIVREPISRLKSVYGFLRRPTVKQDDNFAAQCAQSGLADFVQSPLANVDNVQVRYLSAMQIDGRMEREVTASDFERALSNIRRFYLVGTLEEFDKAIQMFATALGWESVPTYSVTNVSSVQIDVDDNTVQLIESRNQWDRKLWELVHAHAC